MTRRIAQDDLLHSTAADWRDADNVDLLARWQPMTDWMDARLAEGLDAGCKSNSARIGPHVVGRDRAGRGLSGLNLAMQDALSLASHPQILTAASAAARRFGVHAAGPAAQMGLSTLTAMLEDRLSMFLGCEDATVFASGWLAGYGAVTTLVREGDHVLIDRCTRSCLQDGARASGARLHPVPHRGEGTIADRLERLRDEDPQAGILVVVSAMAPCESEAADLERLQRLCKRHAATLMVDVTHDLGILGQTGRGVLEMQQMLGKVDVVLGSFARVFASNGGFVASSHPALKLALRLGSSTQADTTALSPVQAAVALAALDIITNQEGAERRARLIDNARRLRQGLDAAGFRSSGQPGAVISVPLGRVGPARRLTADLLAHGVLVNLEEGLDDPGDACWRLKPMADHSPEDIDTFISVLTAARDRLIAADESSYRARYAVA
ncbi:aminotransferase class I/II-fold pyridoxal phosphate-dependent enzyme [Gemmobacter caeruleus]|uniref:aminotransferase class I/II-fold pyridoxal phosphate-dependent enzyme n=1 Tax=Gemmobacter caeruleus TaxID=2595004 RepID=UPI0011F0802F|nr:pyridoxal phosphate-dependent aminotransferase family protein [Gemmobacter caeruleus]